MKGYLVIPARYGSTRLPGKLLLPIGGKPVIRWVAETAVKVKNLKTILATDDERIANEVSDLPIKIVFTPSDIPSGTDRVASALSDFEPLPFVVNLQGDEPFITPQVIDALVSAHESSQCEIFTLMRRLKEDENPLNPNLVKVAIGKNDRAVYFSRSPIPYFRESAPSYFIHIGIYSFRWDSLFRFVSLPQGELEAKEKLEQLRAIEEGMCIGVKEVEYDGIGIDTPADLVKAESLLQLKSKRDSI